MATVVFKQSAGADACVAAMGGGLVDGRHVTAEIWDGRTKYEVQETQEQREERMKKWDEYLNDGGEGSKVEGHMGNEEDDGKKESRDPTGDDIMDNGAATPYIVETTTTATTSVISTESVCEVGSCMLDSGNVSEQQRDNADIGCETGGNTKDNGQNVTDQHTRTDGQNETDQHTRTDGQNETDQHTRTDGQNETDQHTRTDGQNETDQHTRTDGQNETDQHTRTDGQNR